MIKVSLCFVLSTLLLSCRSKKDATGHSSAKNDTTYTIDKEKILRIGRMNITELHISKFLDSLSNANSEAELPEFLLDTQFDYKHRSIWLSMHNPISVRNEIINRVINCKTLELIILSTNPKFKKIPLVEDNIVVPLGEFSLYDLSVRRFNELNCHN